MSTAHTFWFNWFHSWCSWHAMYFKLIWYVFRVNIFIFMFSNSNDSTLFINNFAILLSSQVMKHADLSITMVLPTATITAVTLFFYCYFAVSATNSFLRMADCLYECNWYEVPVDLQKAFIVMIQNIHQPIYYHGFGIVFLNLETFTKVSDIKWIQMKKNTHFQYNQF